MPHTKARLINANKYEMAACIPFEAAVVASPGTSMISFVRGAGKSHIQYAPE